MIVPGERICQSSLLIEGGAGVRFEVAQNGRPEPAFVIRYGGRPHAYINRCAHKFVELDWEPGQFFDDTHSLLICATHGALYDPATGLCVAGPCRGARLVRIGVVERDGGLWLAESTGAMLE